MCWSLNIIMAIDSSNRKEFIERSSKTCGLNLCQGLKQLVYENVDSFKIKELTSTSEPPVISHYGGKD